MRKPIQKRILETAEAVAREACNIVLTEAEKAIRQKGTFHLVLAGGTTPAFCYRMLAQSKADWAHWHIYFGDERCLPVTDPERNSQLADETWLSQVPIPTEQIHPIPAEQGAEIAAENYSQTIKTALPFDLVLLGMGEDGHTASLFPGHDHESAHRVVPVHHAPKPPPDRVSLNYATLANCHQLLILVTGESKKRAMEQWLKKNSQTLPIARIQAKNSALLLMDQAASPL